MDFAFVPHSIVADGGPAFVWTIVLAFVFLECAFIIGLFLPGDSLLITGGMVIAAHDLPVEHIWALSIGATLAAVAGSQVGYMVGKRTGRHMHARAGGRYFNATNLTRVANFIDKHGFWAVLVSRWIPWVRTLCPVVAGAAEMDHRRYTIASALGAIIWAPVLLLIGYYAGNTLLAHGLVRNIVVGTMVAGIVVGTVLGVRHYLQEMSRPTEDLDIPDHPRPVA